MTTAQPTAASSSPEALAERAALATEIRLLSHCHLWAATRQALRIAASIHPQAQEPSRLD